MRAEIHWKDPEVPTKAKVEGVTETFRTWGDPAPVRVSTRWLVSCPCKRDRYLAVTAAWEAALQIALLHGRTFHDS